MLNPASKVDEPANRSIPKSFKLCQNYPNPFNPTTVIRYQVPRAEKVTITVYNLLGREIKVLVNEAKPVGYISIIWDGRDNDNREVANGIYICKMVTGRFSKTIKMILLK